MEFLIGAVLLSLPLTVIGIVFYLSFFYSEGRMAGRVGQRFGFQVDGKSLSKPGWQLNFHNCSKGRSTEYLMSYEVQLDGLPSDFHLVQRGETSAFLCQRGFVSQQSGDEDFDGLFHHQGERPLKVGQRGLLVDLWQLLPEFGINNNKVSGQLIYEQSPQGLAKLNQVVERLESLQKEFPGAEAYARTRPVGFVRRQKLRQESTVCLAGAAIAGAPALAYATYADVAGSSLLSPATVGCLLLLLTAVGFAASGFRVSAGSYSAVRTLGWTHKLALLSGLLVLTQAVPWAHSPVTTGFLGVTGLVFVHITLGQLKQKWEGILDGK